MVIVPWFKCKFYLPLFFAGLLVMLSCFDNSKKANIISPDTLSFSLPYNKPADTLLTIETRSLWNKLKSMKGKGILFGQQDANIKGINWKNIPEKSDVKDVTGSDPALFGYELGGIGNEINIDSIPFSVIRERIIESFNKGAVNTITWHMNNPVTGGDAHDVTPALSQILPDSSLNEFYKNELKKIALFLKGLKNDKGKLVPIIFRPFHENNGNWFWWGKGHSTPDEYKELWKFTVSYLRDSLNVHNLLYAYSPDIFENEEQYLERYPGDEWVDILGCENYWDFQSGSSVSKGIAQLRMLVDLASERNKIAALTECGFNGIPIKNWWTQFLLKSIKEDSLARNISYLMVWRNSDLKQYYTPFEMHKSASDFILFEKDSFTLFQKDLPDLYNEVLNKND